MIRCTRFALFAALGLAMAGPAFAGVDLIATDQLDGHGGALAYRTSGPLENNVPGNVLGGLGSGLAYAGCNTFLALPDRGPNAVAYDALADDTRNRVRFTYRAGVIRPEQNLLFKGAIANVRTGPGLGRSAAKPLPRAAPQWP